MNPRQAQNFLYEWERRRQAGIGRLLLLGAGIGALGGLLFAALMWALSPNLTLNEEELPPFVLLFALWVGPVLFLFTISLLAFAGLGAFLALIGWRKLNAQANALWAQGYRPAAEKPTYSWKDRAPGLIVAGLGLLLIAGLLFGVWWELNRAGL